MEIEPGAILHNRYQVERRLGRGGMGAVYLARDTALEHPVAVKVNQNPAPESTALFLREARLLAALRHPNLPRVIDYFLIDQEQFLVMDYIPGEDLAVRIYQNGPQPLEEVLRWAEQLGSAISYLHRQEPPVIHRDIKPANIKITPDGQAILVDFGIAKASDSSQTTAVGASGYTPGFAPPEQYGSGRTGPRSDQYSLAATLYMALTGKQPADSVQRVLGKVTLIPPSGVTPAIPAYVDAALSRAMSVHPEERYENVGEFIKALTIPNYQPTVFSQRPFQPAPPSPGGLEVTVASPQALAGKDGKPKRSRSWFWGAALGLFVIGGLFLGVGGGLGAFAFLNARATTVSPTNPPEAASVIGQPSPAMSNAPALPTATQQVKASDTPLPPTPEPSATFAATPSPAPALAALGKGGWIAFSSDRADGKTFQIWLMHIALTDQGQPAATDLKQLTDGSGDKTQPAWSPDGKELLYVAPADPATGKALGLDVWKIDLDGGSAVDLTLRKGDDTDPAWSPDGKWIAFTSHARADKLPQLYLTNPTGGEFRRISMDYAESQPVWSADMSWLIYVISASFNNYLFLYDRPEQAIPPTPVPTPHAFDRTAIFGRLGQVAEPSISQDGSYMAYTRIQNSVTQVCILKMATRGADIAVLTSTGSDRHPAWSPDANWLAFSSKRDGNLEIYVMTQGGTQQTNLTHDPARDQQPAWQPITRP